MLTFDPLKRVSAVKALEHPYFQDEEPATQTESLNQGVKSAAGGICVWVQDSFYWFSVLFLHPNRGLNTQTSELEGHRHRRGSVIICVPSLKTEPVVLVFSRDWWIQNAAWVVLQSVWPTRGLSTYVGVGSKGTGTPFIFNTTVEIRENDS